MNDRAANAIDDGWIYVPYPAAAPGWYRVLGVRHGAGWSEFDCGRGTPYIVGGHVEVRWSPERPVGS